MFLLPLDAHGEAQTVVIRGRCLAGKRNPMASGKRCDAGSMGFGAPASALSGPEDSSMIRALADLRAHLFSDFGVYSGPVSKETNQTLVRPVAVPQLEQTPAMQQAPNPILAYPLCCSSARGSGCNLVN